tara:strand:- start:3870 stop:5840 length:1971 start_codon:yes stop_codon:yes gene_type:complete
MVKLKAETIEDTINQVFDDILKRYPNITDKRSKTGGISLYVSNGKFLQISENTRDRIEFLILRDPVKNYCRPQYDDLDIRNIRQYDPTKESYIRPWGYMFYRVLVTIKEYSDNKNVLDHLIDSSYEIGEGGKVLKVSKGEHEQLGPIFEGTYIFEENDKFETSGVANHDFPVSSAIFSEDKVDVVESKEVSIVDEKIANANQSDADRQIFNHINEDPKKVISVLKNIDISLFKKLISKKEANRLSVLDSLLKKYKIPKEYVTAFLDNKLSDENFIELVKNLSRLCGSPSKWFQFDFVMDCYKAFNKNIEETINELKSIEKKSINPNCGIKPKRLIDLLQSPITPILDMTMDEAKLIFGSPNSDKEDVMKTKTVVTWTYLKPSNKIDRDIEALELKFRNGKLDRYIDKRDKTKWSDNLKSIRNTIYKSSNTKEDILQMYLAYHSLFEGKVVNDYEKCEENIWEDIYDSFIANISTRINNLTDSIANYKNEEGSFSQYLLESHLKSSINKGENELPLSDGKWLYSSSKFTKAKEIYFLRIDKIKNNQEILVLMSSLNSCIKEGKSLLNPPKSGCFIATATMGDINHPTVLHLREFRDLYLLKKKWGASFVRYYYNYGPYPARIIEKSPILKYASYFIFIKPLTLITKKLLRNKNIFEV